MIFSKKKRPSFRQGSMRSCIPLLEFCIKLIPDSESFKWKVPKSKAQQEETALDSLDPLLEQGQLEVISRVAVSPLSHCLSNHKKLLVFSPHISENNNRGLDLTSVCNNLFEALLKADTALGTGDTAGNQTDR